jgi:chromosome segregation ATPase
MNRIIKLLVVPLLVVGCLSATNLQAAPRDPNASNKIVTKLQSMVKDITVERDLLKTEKDKLASEIDQVKQEKTAAAAAEDRLSSELEAQKSSNAAVRSTLEQTHAKLLEVIEKYNALNQAKNELSATHANLQNTQKLTEGELQSCEGKNIKMFEASREVLNNYESKGVLDTLLQAEPILGFKSVEMENIVQEYQGKLTKLKYQHKDIASTNNTAPETTASQKPN